MPCFKHRPGSWHNLASDRGQREYKQAEAAWDREGIAGTTQLSIMLRESHPAQDKLELYQMV